jgi:hypothetical protein
MQRFAYKECAADTLRVGCAAYLRLQWRLSAATLRAVATQALNEIPHQKAKHYVEAYGVLRVFLEQERAGRNERRARASKRTV